MNRCNILASIKLARRRSTFSDSVFSTYVNTCFPLRCVLTSLSLFFLLLTAVNPSSLAIAVDIFLEVERKEGMECGFSNDLRKRRKDSIVSRVSDTHRISMIKPRGIARDRSAIQGKNTRSTRYNKTHSDVPLTLSLSTLMKNNRSQLRTCTQSQ